MGDDGVWRNDLSGDGKEKHGLVPESYLEAWRLDSNFRIFVRSSFGLSIYRIPIHIILCICFDIFLLSLFTTADYGSPVDVKTNPITRSPPCVPDPPLLPQAPPTSFKPLAASLSDHLQFGPPPIPNDIPKSTRMTSTATDSNADLADLDVLGALMLGEEGEMKYFVEDLSGVRH
ncbi:hypothetical protein K435DRAFT_179732 [Dendrothele bispora CBS 962.96]|uniref:Uncharacterized protein n=1 Tax=Dendrothele bispora (strain CBS 962.96) TaxID=1314807 RepID=A0A4S8LWB7_DENBC|nr:hypothetical protein K435DRAFT_179732 [Dendrothele bispora CBS 962.96]